jgi:hypothetical protein
LLDGMQSSVASTASTIVARDATGAINARDGIFSRTANTGFTYFGSNFANYIGSDGVNIVTNGLPFKVTGNSSVTGNHSVVGEITSTSGNFVTQGQSAAANAHYWYKSNLGVNRAVEYHSPSDSTWNLQLYNTAGASVRAISYRQSDGQLSFGGFLAASGAVYAGSSQHTTEGNLTFNGGMAGFGPDLYNALNARIKNDGGWYGINITGTANVAGVAATLRQSGTGAGMTFNWSGQAGQPSWLWGGSDGANMYVYNPSNFSVNYAATANNATYLGGENANQYSRVSYSTNINETNFPLGAYRIGLYSLNTNRIHDVNLRLYTDTRIYHAGGGGGALLAGTWRACGCIEGNNGVFLYQRVG